MYTLQYYKVNPMSVKQIIVVREDLKMSRGKIASQVAHASMKNLVDAMSTCNTTNKDFCVDDSGDSCIIMSLDLSKDADLRAWLEGSFTKIVVYVQSEAKLQALYDKCKDAGLRTSMIIDNGATEFNGERTKTCIAIGPHKSEVLDPITKRYPLLK